jgi:ATP-dependent RNA/DNA helicase IGHMBP2
LRVGNTTKVDEEIYPHTPEGKMAGSRALKEIKDLKKRAEEFRRMALKYKRSFGKAEREQRNLLFKEVKSIRAEIRKLENYEESRFFDEAQVIAGTPVGLCDAGLGAASFHTLVIDEAGQCLEPLAWCIFPFAERYVLAGDPYQLPPTVLSAEAAKAGFNQSLLEVAMQGKQEDPSVFLLNVQYRMRPQIAGFSSAFFYGGKLMHGPGRIDEGVHLSFVDTAGSGYQEEQGKEGMSLRNDGELRIVKRILEEEAGRPLAVISPYSGQVSSAREQLPPSYRISTIDSFQGQEQDIIVVSLVRSNDDGEIGFLKDYRRMNVAITRAREKLIIIGDSATLGTDPFYQALLAYVEECGTYRSVWEFEWDD